MKIYIKAKPLIFLTLLSSTITALPATLEQRQKAATESPSRQTLRALANHYLIQGNEDAWLKYMTAILDLPFNRLDEAYTNADIARHFIQKGEWEKARPYQEAAALRGYSTHMMQAAWLNAALGNTQRGLLLMEQDSTRAQTAHLQTYILAFNVTPSERSNLLLDRFYNKYSAGDENGRARTMGIALIRNDYEDAVQLLTSAMAESNDPWPGLVAALLCEEKGWTEQRDQILTDTVKRYPRYRKGAESRRRTKELIDLYSQINKAGKLSEPLTHKILALNSACESSRSSFNRAYIGELFRLKGDKPHAKEIYSNVLSVISGEKMSDYVAYRGLRLIGEDPVKLLNERRLQQTGNQG
jgi:hypothetical protein